MKCPHCDKYLFFFDRVIEEIRFCPFCGEKIMRVDSNTIGIRKTNLNKGLQIGDTLRFGLYPQNENKPTIIEWLVLHRVDDYVLVQSKNALDYQPYHTGKNKVPWEASSLRKWLNQDFLLHAFSGNNFNNILFTSSKDHNIFLKDIPIDHDLWDLMDHYDRIFLLNYEDLVNFHLLPDHTKKEATKYTLSKGGVATRNGCSWWWTQTSSNLPKNMKFISPTGELCEYGAHINSRGSVCPAMWIKI